MSSDSSINVLEKLGEGTYGVVYKERVRLANEAEDRLSARKVSKQEFLPVERVGKKDAAYTKEYGVASILLKEAQCLQVLKGHPNIVSIQNVFFLDDDDNNNNVSGGDGDVKVKVPHLAMTMEFFGSGTLREYIIRLLKTEKFDLVDLVILKRVSAQIAHAMAFMHAQCIIHCDLKPCNIVMGCDGSPHIIDMGLACILVPPKQMIHETVAYTQHFRAPEVFLSNEVGYKSEAFSVGIVLLQTLFALPISFMSPHQAFVGEWDFLAVCVWIIELTGLPRRFLPAFTAYIDAQFADMDAEARLGYDIDTKRQTGARLYAAKVLRANSTYVFDDITAQDEFLRANIKRHVQNSASKHVLDVFAQASDHSEQAVEFLTRLLRFDPALRLTVREALDTTRLFERFVSPIARDPTPHAPHASQETLSKLSGTCVTPEARIDAFDAIVRMCDKLMLYASHVFSAFHIMDALIQSQPTKLNEIQFTAIVCASVSLVAKLLPSQTDVTLDLITQFFMENVSASAIYAWERVLVRRMQANMLPLRWLYAQNDFISHQDSLWVALAWAYLYPVSSVQMHAPVPILVLEISAHLHSVSEDDKLATLRSMCRNGTKCPL